MPLQLSKGMPKISSKNQITLPVEVLREAGLEAGDEVQIVAGETNEIVVRRPGMSFEAAIGVFDGLYEPGYLDRLRAEERY